MPRNGSGSYSLPEAAFVPGSTISSAAVNSDFSDIALALTGSVAADGQTPITGPITFSDGTFSAPGITFNSDTDTGIYRGADNTLGFALGGVASFGMAVPSSTAGSGLTGVSGAVLVPIGAVSFFAGSSAPSGWLLCYGQSLLRASYAELFSVIGTTYGAADATHFSLPDLRGRTGVGLDNMGGSSANRLNNAACDLSGVRNTLGGAGGEGAHTLTTPEIATHSHGVTDPGHTHALHMAASVIGVSGANFIAPSVGNPFGTGLANSVGTTDSSTTGITTQNAGGGGAHNNCQPSLMINMIIFAGRP